MTRLNFEMIESGLVQNTERVILRRLRKHYDQLWLRAIGRIREGEVELDPVLQARVPDRRRGLTVIAKPSPAVRQKIGRFLRELHRLEPEQYYYTSNELHLTVLSLFTATETFEPFMAQKERYIAAVDAALNGAAPIRIVFKGVTASPGTVMIQGFFETDELPELRDRLRYQLRLRRLEKGVDERYRLQTAHMTLVRFRAPLHQAERFAKALELARRRPFGATTIRNFSLVKNDWYMSAPTTVTVKHYR